MKLLITGSTGVEMIYIYIMSITKFQLNLHWVPHSRSKLFSSCCKEGLDKFLKQVFDPYCKARRGNLPT
jgi:hypothetical protein